MKPLPHEYQVTVHAPVEGDVSTLSPGLDDIAVAPPADFGGPGDRWSPETLFLAAIADCFALTFRAVANAARVQWSALDCHASGTLDKAEGGIRFTAVNLTVKLQLAAGENEEKAVRLLHKAEQNCLVSNSLAVAVELAPEVVTAA